MVMIPRADFLVDRSRAHVLGLGIGEGYGLDDQRSGILLALSQRPLLVILAGEDGHRSDSENIALDHLPHFVVSEDDIERLIPGDVAQVAGDHAADVRVEDDVEVGKLSQVEDDIPKVGVLEFQTDDFPGVLFLLAGDNFGLEFVFL